MNFIVKGLSRVPGNAMADELKWNGLKVVIDAENRNAHSLIYTLH